MMATLGTLLGCVLSLPVAWFGALNVTPSRFIAYPVGRFMMVLSRSVHEIIWALLFVGAVGLGALPGMLAVAMRSVGFISKITAEAFENIDPKPVEAIRAVGGNHFQVMYYGIVPQILPGHPRHHHLRMGHQHPPLRRDGPGRSRRARAGVLPADGAVQLRRA